MSLEKTIVIILCVIALAVIVFLIVSDWSAIRAEKRSEFNEARARRDVEALLADANTEVFTRPRVRAGLYQPNERNS